jgi:TetR/AcrR family transcriptional regulator, transcriptional repressor for nem operon
MRQKLQFSKVSLCTSVKKDDAQNISNFLNPILLVGSLIAMSGDTAERIMDVAHQLLAERGFSAFSYADIAEAIQIRKASIHHHFPTKAALVVAVLERHRNRMKEETDALDQQISSPLDRLRKYVAHWEACIHSSSEPFCIAALLGAELPSLPPEVQAEVKKHFKYLRGWIAQTLEQGVKKRVIKLSATPDVEADALMAVVHGAMISARTYGSDIVFKQVTADAIQHLSRN